MRTLAPVPPVSPAAALVPPGRACFRHESFAAPESAGGDRRHTREITWRLAVVGKAMAELWRARGLPDVPFLLPISVDLRPKGEPGPVFGNSLAFHFARFRPSDTTDVGRAGPGSAPADGRRRPRRPDRGQRGGDGISPVPAALADAERAAVDGGWRAVLVQLRRPGRVAARPRAVLRPAGPERLSHPSCSAAPRARGILQPVRRSPQPRRLLARGRGESTTKRHGSSRWYGRAWDGSGHG